MTTVAPVVPFQEYRATRRAADVMRGLLRELPMVMAVKVELTPEGRSELVVVVCRDTEVIVRACVPTSVNAVPVVVRSI